MGKKKEVETVMAAKKKQVNKEVESGHAEKDTHESLVYQAKLKLHEAHTEGDKDKIRQLEKELVKLCDDIEESNKSSNPNKKHHGNKKA